MLALKKLIKKITPNFLLNWYYLLLPLVGAIGYRFPAKKLKVIGVTGTNGKSTVVFMITEILTKAGFKVASISSLRSDSSRLTMPGRLRLQKLLRQAVKAGCQYAVVEVTSEGIRQQRHRFIDFEAVVFTNLAPEHIESHGSFEKYRAAKGRLFQACRNIHIINADDENSAYFWQWPAKKKMTYRVKDDQILIDGLDGGSISLNLKLKLLGKFNLSNAAAALCLGLSLHISLAVGQKALEDIESVPGRMEIIVNQPFKVIVDYAHTPDALEKVYQAIPGEKICLLGSAGGGRDKWKRPELGRIAGKYCSQIILSNEDPYDENPQHILEQIESGLWPKAQGPRPNYIKILDRREAIKKALRWAKPGQTVIITGKGSEQWMSLAGRKKIPWDDRQIVKEALKELA